MCLRVPVSVLGELKLVQQLNALLARQVRSVRRMLLVYRVLSFSLFLRSGATAEMRPRLDLVTSVMGCFSAGWVVLIVCVSLVSRRAGELLVRVRMVLRCSVLMRKLCS